MIWTSYILMFQHEATPRCDVNMVLGGIIRSEICDCKFVGVSDVM